MAGDTKTNETNRPIVRSVVTVPPHSTFLSSDKRQRAHKKQSERLSEQHSETVIGKKQSIQPEVTKPKKVSRCARRKQRILEQRKADTKAYCLSRRQYKKAIKKAKEILAVTQQSK